MNVGYLSYYSPRNPEIQSLLGLPCFNVIANLWLNDCCSGKELSQLSVLYYSVRTSQKSVVVMPWMYWYSHDVFEKLLMEWTGFLTLWMIIFKQGRFYICWTSSEPIKTIFYVWDHPHVFCLGWVGMHEKETKAIIAMQRFAKVLFVYLFVCFCGRKWIQHVHKALRIHKLHQHPLKCWK